jgi:WD40 repeat protein
MKQIGQGTRRWSAKRVMLAALGVVSVTSWRITALRIFHSPTVRPGLVLRTRHHSTVASIAFSPDGRTLASGKGNHTVQLWDVPTGRLKGTLTGHSLSVTSVAFSPDGETLASGSNDGTVRLWHVQ